MYFRHVDKDMIIYKNENEQTIMSIREELSNDNNYWNLTVAGRLYGKMTKQFMDELDPIINGNQSIIIDFENVTFIESDVLRILLDAQNKIEEDNRRFFEIINPNVEVMKIFRDTGFDQLLNIK
ncbi:MAG: STAS domain-containing protein [Candidatus Delongbacteria bacterium]|nr:STAS domain-containing protein [Candidatus Delongbacteria bacterium]